ncbi:hypothetical protein UFOVP820_46 [uncultured Caudovirales phage]|uniref:Tip attachment protein J n=1 Tax=uncultured Caudovirales phage TaxID=2100421 RepID=A0A6J5P626_9CAUD|nr:hypothetical protein UFOVP820_46 [uncultured Caudovirales phage]
MQVIAAIASFFMTAGFPAYAAYAAAFAIVAVALTAVGKALAPKMPRGDGRSLEASFNDSTAAQRIIFGQVRTGGVYMIPFITTGTKGDYGHIVMALSGHELNDITDIYFDNQAISSASIGAITGSTNDGLIASGRYGNHAWVRRYKGTATQTVDFILNSVDPTAFSSDFRLRGWGYIAVQLKYNTNIYTSVPQITAVLQGAKLYDPRLDSTNGGTGTQRYTDPTTWTYSKNPALCTAWYLMSALGGEYDAATEIDWSLVSAAANICDTPVSVPTGTQNRYTCNGLLLVTEKFEDNLQKCIDAMMGRITWRGGKWRVYAGAWTTPTETLDRSDFLGAINFESVQPRAEGRWNGARAYYVDPDRNYQRVECFPRVSSSYKTADGNERIWIELEQPLCNNEFEAQRKAEFILRQSRNNIRVMGKLGPRWQRLSLWDTVYLDWAEVGYNDKTMRLVSYTLNPDGTVDVILAEEQSTDWTDMASGEYNSISIATFTTTTPKPDAPAALNVSGDYNAIQVNWTLVTSSTPLPNQSAELWEGNSQYLDASYSLVWEGSGQSVTRPKDTASYYYYRVRHKIPGGYYSDYVPSTGGTVGNALANPSGGAFAITGITGSVSALPNSTPSQKWYLKLNVANPANASSVGYRWEVFSSDVSSATKPWSATNITSQMATFQMGGLVNGDTYTIYVRGFASDTTPSSKSIDTAIEFTRDTGV